MLNNETTPCTYKTLHTSHGTEVVAAPDGAPWYAGPFLPCNNGLAYQPVVVSQLKPSLAAAKQALQIKEMPEDYPGVTVDLTAVRHYPRPDGALASSMLGYIQLIGPTQLDNAFRDRAARSTRTLRSASPGSKRSTRSTCAARQA